MMWGSIRHNSTKDPMDKVGSLRGCAAGWNSPSTEFYFLKSLHNFLRFEGSAPFEKGPQ